MKPMPPFIDCLDTLALQQDRPLSVGFVYAIEGGGVLMRRLVLDGSYAAGQLLVLYASISYRRSLVRSMVCKFVPSLFTDKSLALVEAFP